MVLLAVANMLSKVRESSQFKTGISNVMFAFLNGESFDYIGSSNMVYNMKKSAFPSSDEVEGAEKVDDNETNNASNANMANGSWPKIDIDSLKFVIELGQLNSNNAQLYAHVDTHCIWYDYIKLTVASEHHCTESRNIDKNLANP